MSKAILVDSVTAVTANTDLTLAGNGTGVPNLEAAFKVGGVAPTAGQVVTDAGWAAPAGGGAWTLIGTAVAGASSSIDFTSGIDATYSTYALVVESMVLAYDGAGGPSFRFGDSGGFDSAAGDYMWITASNLSQTPSGFVGSGTGSATGINFAGSSNGTGPGENMSATIYFTRPTDGTSYPLTYSTWSRIDLDGFLANGTGGGARKAAITVDRVQIAFFTTIASGRATLYGISHA